MSRRLDPTTRLAIPQCVQWVGPRYPSLQYVLGYDVTPLAHKDDEEQKFLFFRVANKDRCQ